MPESGFHRPRRAQAHDTNSDEPIAADDTSATSAGGARRGLEPRPTDTVGGQAGDDVDVDAAEVAEQAQQQDNPFARPGSDNATSSPPPAPHVVPIPAPVLPARDFHGDESGGSGRRMGELADGPTPQPRRSAVSSTTPGEPFAGSHPEPSSPSWVQHHRRTLLTWGIGALVAALVIAIGSFLAVQRGKPNGEPSGTLSPSASVSAAPVVSDADLITVLDAEKIVAGAGWNIVNTAVTSSEAKQKAACLSTFSSDVNPTDTFQRSMGTSSNGLAALHRIDVYASADAAQEVQTERAQALATCTEVPAHVSSSSTVTGLGDDVTQVTIAFQGEKNTAFRTVLLVRTGRALEILDVTRNDEPVAVDAAVAGLQRSLTEVCSRADGLCPTAPVVSAAVPPPVEPTGWLIPSDLERLRPGYGLWSATEPADLTSQGMGCENLPLATEPGPVTRAQRTYLLTQDDTTPESFGMDEMVFDFADAAASQAFINKLVGNLLSCKDRGSLTAQVTDGGAVAGTGADGVAVAARVITIDQAISDDSSVRYQLVVALADTRVSYLLASVTTDYQFPDAQLKALALRTAQRNSQG
ncbi:hypothetical protein [Tessaracoccus sp.]